MEGVEISQLTTVERKGVFLQIVQQYQVNFMVRVDHKLEVVQQKYGGGFEKPRGLSPKRIRDHQINIIDMALRVFVRPYIYPFYQKSGIEKIAQELLDSCVVRSSQSPFSSHVILVRKTYGSWCMCIDYKALSRETIKDKFPIPIIDKCWMNCTGPPLFLSWILEMVIIR